MSTDTISPNVKIFSGHRVLTCFANVESFNPNFNTTSQNYEFQWLKNGSALSIFKKRKNSKNEVIEIIEYINKPLPGIVLTLNEIEVYINSHLFI